MRANELSKVFGSPVTAAQVWGEVVELMQALVAGDVEEIREEVSDVCCFGHYWLWLKVGGLMPAWPAFGADRAAEKFLARFEVWREIFANEGLEFHPRYLVAGGNYRKPHKVVAALSAARLER